MGLWEAVDALAGRTDDLARLRAHRLHLLAARHRMARDLPVWDEVRAEERLSAACALTVPTLLSRIRAVADGQILVMKGPVVAERYPDPTSRPYWDLDLLVPDARALHRRLIGCGWVEIGEPELYVDIHHLRPLAFPGLPLGVELHHRPKWPAGFPAPPLDDVFAHAVPGPADGVLAPDPAHHAVLLTGHAWAHGPLRRVGDLVDVAAMGHAEDAGRIAEAWGCERLWRTTARATEGLLGEAPPPACLKLWARHLRDVRSRTVAEAHLATWLAPGWAAPRRRLRAVMTATRQDLTPGGDGWTAKARRARRAAAGGLTAKDAYDAGLPFEEREPALAAARARRHGGSHGA